MFGYVSIPDGLMSRCRRADEGEWDGIKEHMPNEWKDKWTIVCPESFFSTYYKDRVIESGSPVYISNYACNCGVKNAIDIKNRKRPMIFIDKKDAETVAQRYVQNAFDNDYANVVGNPKDWKNVVRTDWRGSHRKLSHKFVKVIQLKDYEPFSSKAILDKEKEQALKDGIIKTIGITTSNTIRIGKQRKNNSKSSCSNNDVAVVINVKNEWYGIKDMRTNKFMRFNGTIYDSEFVDEIGCTAFGSRFKAATAIEAIEQLGWKYQYSTLRLQATRLSSEISEMLDKKYSQKLTV